MKNIIKHIYSAAFDGGYLDEQKDGIWSYWLDDFGKVQAGSFLGCLDAR